MDTLDIWILHQDLKRHLKAINTLKSISIYDHVPCRVLQQEPTGRIDFGSSPQQVKHRVLTALVYDHNTYRHVQHEGTLTR